MMPLNEDRQLKKARGLSALKLYGQHMPSAPEDNHCLTCDRRPAAIAPQPADGGAPQGHLMTLP